MFNQLYISMVKAGEAGGVLDAVLMRLADTIEKQVELRRKIKSAMTYPIVVLTICAVIATGNALVHRPAVQESTRAWVGRCRYRRGSSSPSRT